MATNNGAIGWDDEVSEADAGNMEQDEFVCLPPGTYKATINKIERGNFAGSTKMSACPMMKIGCIVDGGDKGRSYITTRFYMHTKTLWRIFEFLEAVGVRKKGDSTAARVPWSKVEKGMTCLVKVKIHTYQDNKDNEVEKWIPEKPAEKLSDDDI